MDKKCGLSHDSGARKHDFGYRINQIYSAIGASFELWNMRQSCLLMPIVTLIAIDRKCCDNTSSQPLYGFQANYDLGTSYLNKQCGDWRTWICAE